MEIHPNPNIIGSICDQNSSPIVLMHNAQRLTNSTTQYKHAKLIIIDQVQNVGFYWWLFTTK